MSNERDPPHAAFDQVAHFKNRYGLRGTRPPRLRSRRSRYRPCYPFAHRVDCQRQIAECFGIGLLEGEGGVAGKVEAGNEFLNAPDTRARIGSAVVSRRADQAAPCRSVFELDQRVDDALRMYHDFRSAPASG